MPSTRSSISSSISSSVHAVRGAFLDFVDDLFYVSELESVRYVADGLIGMAKGAIVASINTPFQLKMIRLKVPMKPVKN
jgi:hypothetical protein